MNYNLFEERQHLSWSTTNSPHWIMNDTRHDGLEITHDDTFASFLRGLSSFFLCLQYLGGILPTPQSIQDLLCHVSPLVHDDAVTVSLAVLEVMVRNYVFTRESRWTFWLWLLVVLPVIRLTQSWERSSYMAIDLLIDWIRHDSSFRSLNKSWPLYFYLCRLLRDQLLE